MKPIPTFPISYRFPAFRPKDVITSRLGALIIGCTVFAPLVSHAQTNPFRVTYNFANTTTSTGTTDPTPVPTAPGVIFGSFSANGVSANSTAGGRFAYSGWNTTTPGVDSSRYYEMTLAPVSGMSLGVDSISFGVRRTGTGPRDFSLRSSLDGFASDLGVSSATSPEISVQGNAFRFVNDIAPTANISGNQVQLSSDFDALHSPITFRFYAANPETAAGSFTLDDVTVNGITAVPEPHEYGMMASGSLLLFAAYRRRINRISRG
jgi:hypothetical protein